jgi:hypothetical protein
MLPDNPFKSIHIKFTHSREVFRYPPEPFIGKLKRILKIGRKQSLFILLKREGEETIK